MLYFRRRWNMADDRNSELVAVLEVGSEMEALAIQAFLEDQGIEAGVHSRQIPMYDGIARVWNPVWGEVMVLEPQAARARALIAEYEAVLGEDPPDSGEEE
jgi:hypothetical protein